MAGWLKPRCLMRTPPSPGRLGRADLHLHTLASDGLLSADALLDYAEHYTNLDVIAITDHDEVRAAMRARERAEQLGYRVRVIPGVEVSTRHGHLIGLFVEDRPCAFRSYQETAEWIVARGGLCIAPHPMTRVTHSVSRPVLEDCARRGLIAGVEVWNPSPAGRASRNKALAFAAEHPVAAIGASDAHWRRIVGMASTRFDGSSAEDLRRAILEGTTVAEGRFASALELALEALPQTVWATVVLPLRRLRRFSGDLRGPRPRTLMAPPASLLVPQPTTNTTRLA
jgi:predicted metal-dependent phosphoesterase TrpH